MGAWGHPALGGNCSEGKEYLASDVAHICASEGGAFAALKKSGYLHTWGHEDAGGNCGFVSEQLTADVDEVHSNGFAFAAIKSGRTVVTWGHPVYGGDSTHAQSVLR